MMEMMMVVETDECSTLKLELTALVDRLDVRGEGEGGISDASKMWEAFGKRGPMQLQRNLGLAVILKVI